MIVAKGRVRLRVKVIAGTVALLAVLAGAWVWLRDSSLVAVERVTVTGAAGPDAGQIRSALGLAARNMTTLDVQLSQLRTAVAPYPVVKNLRVSTQFPHGMRIQVIELLPVGALTAGGETVAASADGTLVHDVPTGSLPAVPVQSFPGGSRVTDQNALGALELLADAPPRLQPKISQVATSPPHGLVVQLRSGPSIYFGPAGDFEAKWGAAAAVLAAPGSADASYIDVSDPERPAAGVSSQALSAAGLAASGNGSQTGYGSSPAGSTGTGASDGATGQAASPTQASSATPGA
jgi:cell division protein FtsQ